MRTLITGFSARECGVTKKPAGRFEMLDPVAQAVAQCGELNHRRVRIGEDLSGYDLVVILINQALSMNCWGKDSGVLGCYWAAAQSGLPILVYVTDWQIKSMMSHMKSTIRHPRYLTKEVGGSPAYGGEDPEHITALADHLLYGAAILSGWNGPWPDNVRALFPTFSWGDHDKFAEVIPARRDQYRCVDFSPFGVASVEHPGVVGYDERLASWLLPSLSPQSEWVDKLNIIWPVEYLGSRKLKAERVSEQEVLNRGGQRRGILSPEYCHLVGSGWWRIRYNYAAMTRTVIAGAPLEAASCSEAFRYTPAEVEDLCRAGYSLSDLAHWQGEAMERSYTPLEESQDQLRQVIREAACGS